MVLRLLAFNAEQWLASRLNAYLADNDEYRATLRHPAPPVNRTGIARGRDSGHRALLGDDLTIHGFPFNGGHVVDR